MLRNKVAESGIITLDVSTFWPKVAVQVLEVSVFLEEGILLREKPFRAALAQYPWEKFKGQIVAIVADEEVLVPSWAYMLLGTYLQPHALFYGIGSPQTVQLQYALSLIEKVDWSQYTQKRVVLKGCGDVPPEIYLACTRQLVPYVRKLMYGEPCSAVPIYTQKPNLSV